MAIDKTKKIQQAICKHLARTGHQAICENFDYEISEMDVASLTKNGLIHEFEVKISRSDFKADKRKVTKFQYYEIRLKPYCPNYFFYVCPEGLILPEEVPKWAGLYYYKGGQLFLKKRAKRLHNDPVSELEKVLRKMLRLNIQRKYLGWSWMTYKNKESDKRWKEYYENKEKEANALFADKNK